MANLNIFIPANRNNEDGYVMIASLMVLVLVTIIGVMSIRTSNSDLEISTNDHLLGRSFYAAEAARAFVYANPVLLYGSGNILPPCPNPTTMSCDFQIDSSVGVGFPASTDTTKITLGGHSYRPIISGGQVDNDAFRGRVIYLTSKNPPRESGYSFPPFKAHYYIMRCEGHGPRESIAQIEAGFYRIGPGVL